MKPHICSRQKHIRLYDVTLILTVLFSSAMLVGQTATNFSGKWEFDKTKSSPDLLETTYAGAVILQITQNPSKISFAEIWKKPGTSDFKTAPDSYNLDGKERTRKENVGTNKNSAKWSQDKKVLTITNLDTQELKGVLQDFLTEDSYRLSDNGRTLTIERYSKNPVTGETRTKKIYGKK